MKTLKSYLCISIIILFFSLTTQHTFAQNAAINSDGASPDESAMLDIVSENKGLLIPRIDLVSTTDASTIPSPANGLLIFNTRSGIIGINADGVGYYYNSGTVGAPLWVKLFTNNNLNFWKSSGNSETDTVNNFVGTTDAKSLQLRTNNNNRINISSDGITTIGDGTNQFKVDSIGHIRLEGAASNFDDLTVSPFATYLSGAKSPAFSVMKNNGSGSFGVKTFTFQNLTASNEQEIFFSIQMPHKWKEGSTIYPHIHWASQTATSGAVTWGLEYSWVDYNPSSPLAFPNTTILTATSASVSSGDIDKHLIVDLAPITPSGSQGKISSIIMCRLFRNSSNAADTYSGDAALLSFDVHYEIDAIGSNSLYIK